ncbi:MAG: glycosyltransferase family 4 protein [Deltaproteobacteria bacterium]|nr:glycosyltransferase family 4 protein [Deltaproteobacteria bacterium]
MRVLYLLRYYPTLSETFVYREIGELLRRGVEVEVVALGARPDGALQDQLPQVVVHRPPRGLDAARCLPGPALWGVGADPQTARWLRDQLGAKAAARALWVASLARGFDRLHAHFAGEAAEWARGAARIAGRPYSVTVHAADLFKPRPALQEVLAEASPAVVIAEHHRLWIRDRYRLSSQVVRCGVPLGEAPLARPGVAGPLALIGVGRWTPKKGWDLLLDALSAVPSARLRLVSDVPAGLALGERVVGGPAPPSTVPGLLAAAHLFVLPARVAADGDRDGIPVALMEAMAAGLPVISTAVSGIPELVDEEVGWLIPPEDPAALRRALREAESHPAERQRRGARGRARLSERGFTVEAQADGLLSAWEAAPSWWRG